MDFDDEVSSVSVDAADLMQATVLVMTGFIVSSVASQAVCRRDYLLLQPTHIQPKLGPRSIHSPARNDRLDRTPLPLAASGLLVGD